jgi:uncharacterized protein YecT (DUF1311 family)
VNFGIALVLAAIAPTGEEPPKFRDPPACWDGSQHELNVCAGKEYRQADRAMNEQWSKVETLMKRLDTDDPPNAALGQSSHYQALLNGQRAWLRFRDSYCPIFGASGGSMRPMLENLCLRDITLARTEQLKSLMLNPATGKAYYEDQ